MPLLLSGLSVWFFLKLQKKKYQSEVERKDILLREKNLIIEKQKALEEERNRIAAEMHDDLGGGLTSIKYLSQKMLRKLTDKDPVREAHKINDHAQLLVTNMGEIIWAMNSGFDTLENFTAYTRRYAYEYLEEHEIKIDFQLMGNPTDIGFSGEKRRHLFLVVKEALHNVVKHANASNVIIKISLDNSLNLVVSDNGQGFDQHTISDGNGLKSMKTRIEKLDGKMWIKRDELTHIHFNFPL